MNKSIVLALIAGAAALALHFGLRDTGIVLGAKVPIILTSRADEEIARLASCAVAQLLAAARRTDANAAIQ